MITAKLDDLVFYIWLWYHECSLDSDWLSGSCALAHDRADRSAGLRAPSLGSV